MWWQIQRCAYPIPMILNWSDSSDVFQSKTIARCVWS